MSKDYINYDTSFIKIQIGSIVAENLKKKDIAIKGIELLVLEAIRNEIDFNLYSEDTINKGVSRGLHSAMLNLWIKGEINKSELNKNVFETSPAIFLALQASNFAIEELEKLKFKEHNWNPKLKNFTPLLAGDTIENAFFCGLINGVINEVKAIPELASFFYKIYGDQKELNEFIEGIRKLIDNGIIKTLIESATKEYQEAIKEKNVEKLYYSFAHDIITIISLIIGAFQLAKGVTSFVNLTKKSLIYLKRFGREAIDDLKGLARKQLDEIFDNGLDAKVFKSGSGGFLKFKRVLSRNVFRQEEINSCAAACIRQLAKENDKILNEKVIRDLARTADDGTRPDGIIDAMVEIFGGDKLDMRMMIDSNLDDVRMVKKISENNEPWIALISPSPMDNRYHTVIVNKVIGNEVIIKDPWPIKGIDEKTIKYLDNGDLDHNAVKWMENNGVEGVVDLKEFAEQWAYGQNKMFKLKN